MTFEEAFVIVVGLEGGYVNDPDDPGGETKYGISKRAYPNVDIKSLTKQQAMRLYEKDYWLAAHCDKMDDAIALFVFDSAVNQGVRVAIKLLQRALRLNDDGIWGPKTAAASNRVTKEQVALFLAERALYYADTKNFSKYGRGWFKRLFMVALP